MWAENSTLCTECTVHGVLYTLCTVHGVQYRVHCTVQAGVHVEAPNIISKLKYKYKHGNLCIILNSTNVQSYVTHCTLYSKLRKFVLLPTAAVYNCRDTVSLRLF